MLNLQIQEQLTQQSCSVLPVRRTFIYCHVKVNVKQPHYRPAVAQRVQGS